MRRLRLRMQDPCIPRHHIAADSLIAKFGTPFAMSFMTRRSIPSHGAPSLWPTLKTASPLARSSVAATFSRGSLLRSISIEASGFAPCVASMSLRHQIPVVIVIENKVIRRPRNRDNNGITQVTTPVTPVTPPILQMRNHL